MEPLLEQHRFGLDPENGLPIGERMKHARKVAESDSTDNLFSHIRSEPDITIKAALVAGYAFACRKKDERLSHEIHTSESGMAAISSLNDRDRFRRACAEQVKTLVGQGHMDTQTGRKLIAEMEGAR